MWRLDNRTPYGAERNWTRDERGVHWWLVAVRGCYRLAAGGRLELEEEQVPPTVEPEYFGEPGVSSLRCDSDLLARKPGTDVIVNGSAYAPKGRSASSVPVVLRVGRLEKQLIVYGNRVYVEGVAGLSTTTPASFVEQPVRYEQAFGGGDLRHPDPAKQRLDERNPIGRGFPPVASVWANKPAHTVEYASGSVNSRGPAGFGAIDRGWLPRRRYAGTYDSKWVQTKSPLLADDYDARHALSAPEDQRTEAPLIGGERIGVLNMSPDGSLVFELPRVELRFTTSVNGRKEPHGQTMTSVVIEPSDKRVCVTWQSVLRVAAPDLDYLDSTRIEEA